MFVKPTGNADFTGPRLICSILLAVAVASAVAFGSYYVSSWF